MLLFVSQIKVKNWFSEMSFILDSYKETSFAIMYNVSMHIANTAE